MRFAAATLLVLSFVLGGCGNADVQMQSGHMEDAVQRQIKYGFSVSNPTNRVVKDIRVRVYAPISEPGVQEVADIKATMPFAAYSGKGNTNELEFGFAELQPYGVKDVWITVTINLHPQRTAGEDAEIKSYLSASQFVEVDDARIASQLTELRAQNELDSLRNVHSWMVENIKDEGYVREDKGAVYALSQRKGDCTEQAYLFMALSRALGVPARGVAGFVQPNDGVVRSRDYHNWAEVLVDGAWRVADPLRDKFLTEEIDYIAMAYLEAGRGGSQSFFGVTGNAVVEFK